MAGAGGRQSARGPAVQHCGPWTATGAQRRRHPRDPTSVDAVSGVRGQDFLDLKACDRCDPQRAAIRGLSGPCHTSPPGASCLSVSTTRHFQDAKTTAEQGAREVTGATPALVGRATWGPSPSQAPPVADQTPPVFPQEALGVPATPSTWKRVPGACQAAPSGPCLQVAQGTEEQAKRHYGEATGDVLRHHGPQ